MYIKIYPITGMIIAGPKWGQSSTIYQDFSFNLFLGYVKETTYFIYRTNISNFKNVCVVDAILEYQE